MGVKCFYKIFDCAVSLSDNDIKNMRLAFDAYNDIYRAALGARYVNQLTDKEGDSTVHLNVILQNIIRFYKNGNKVVYVFDGENSVLKTEELRKRSQVKNKAQQRIDKIKETPCDAEPDVVLIDIDKNNPSTPSKELPKELPKELTHDEKAQIDRLEKQTFSITNKMLRDVKYMLKLLGIDCVISPDGVEAEQVAACMTKLYQADVVVTNDSDALIYGATAILKRDKVKGKNVYSKYELHTILDKYNLWPEELIKIAIALGTDMAPKTPGIGPKSVFNYVKSKQMKMTERQHLAFKHFIAPCQPNCWQVEKGTQDLTELRRWLVDVKGFSEDRIKKLLAQMPKL